MQRKVLFTGYDFQEENQRGIYLYSKSLMHATKQNGYQTGILSHTLNSRYPDVMLTRVYQSLIDPNNKTFSRNLKMGIKRYFEYNFLKKENSLWVDNKERMFTEENFWFLKDIDFFLNVPAFYFLTSLAQRLPNQYSSLNADFKEMSKSDIIFTTAPLNIKSKSKLVQTIHDTIPMNISIHDENPTNFYKRLMACNNSDKLLSVSDFTKQQFLEFFPQAEDRIQTVYQPIPTDDHSLYLSSLPKVQEAVLRKYKLKPKQYMYYVGAIEARKNIHRLIQAYELATNGDKDMPLVLSGSIDPIYAKKTKLGKYFSEAKYDQNGKPIPKKHNIIKTDYVTEVEKLCLIRNARAFLFPTLNEGFGIPALEGQTLGAPVLTTNNSSLPEVVGDTALMVNDPFNIEEMAEQIECLWNDDALCERLSKEGLVNAERFSKDNFKKNIGQFLKDI